MPKLNTARRADAKADSEDGFQVVVLDLATHAPGVFLANYSEFPNSCLKVLLPVFVNAFQVLVDRRDRHLKQLCHQRLGEPDRVSSSNRHAVRVRPSSVW